MKLSVNSIEQIEVQIAGRVVMSVHSATPGFGTFNLSTAPEENAIITEAVRRTICEYGDTLRKLSNE